MKVFFSLVHSNLKNQISFRKENSLTRIVWSQVEFDFEILCRSRQKCQKFSGRDNGCIGTAIRICCPEIVCSQFHFRWLKLVLLSACDSQNVLTVTEEGPIDYLEQNHRRLDDKLLDSHLYQVDRWQYPKRESTHRHQIPVVKSKVKISSNSFLSECILVKMNFISTFINQILIMQLTPGAQKLLWLSITSMKLEINQEKIA